ncbi:hypothetical protein [Streptomyces sp. 1222.5]|uniref:hypothetical protein n=1 Tax=Streptomyces sp. 1222.5 TaxID=1881026 RepID=UPI003D7380A1
MSTSSLIPIDTIDLAKAAEQIRPGDSPLADLLEAVADVDDEALHSMVEWPSGETECIEGCTPCTAKYAAQTVAAAYLRALAEQETTA